MVKHACYSYAPIESDQLRMCRFIEDGEFLVAQLETFPADGSHTQYTSLSYTWALTSEGPKYDWAIQIGQSHLPALASLQPFIQALRWNKTLLDGTWWWIDSICIDQSNIEERGAHVRRMRDIYKNAHEVVVWLGESSEDSCAAPGFIDHLGQLNAAKLSNHELRGILHQEQYQDQWVALTHFFLRKWWTRVWTIQEFVLPEDVTFWYGSKPLNRDAVFAALAMADRCNAPGFKSSIAFHHAFNRRRVWMLNEFARKPGRDVSLSLLALSAYFCNNEATDDRDRLFGLTGLSKNDHGLNITYASTVDDVYIQFATSFVTEHRSLDIIAFASLFVATPGALLPSWVPDWRARIQPLVAPLMVSQSSTAFVGNLRPPRLLEHEHVLARYSASGTRDAAVEFEGATLLAQGCIIDVVDDIAGSPVVKNIESADDNCHGIDGGCSPTEVLASICRCLALGRGDRYMQHPMPTEQFCSDFTLLCLSLISGKSHGVQNEFQEWFRDVRSLRFQGQTFEEILRDVRQNHADLEGRSVPPQDEYIQDSFYGRFFDTVERMALRLMTSLNGRVGMLPRRASKGDLICILFGCNVPLILREEPRGRFIVVGECYLDGCMEGEVLEYNDIIEKTFRIE